MHTPLFTGCLGLLLLLLFGWAFRRLPEEKWQILAIIPRLKSDERHWQGLNLTWYGFFIASAYAFALALLLVLLHTAGMNLAGVSVIMLALLASCLPAARIVARIVEKKSGTFTVAGASFTGLMLLPGLVYVVNLTLGRWLGFEISLLVMLAGIATAYAFGEGIGRLACISFGCCYGKALEQCHVRTRSLFQKCHFIFSGKTKKIAYASGLDGQPVIPIQAITATVCCLGGLVGVYLFLSGFYMVSAMVTLGITQIWRLISEIWRADYRGQQRFSAYQSMAVAALMYMLLILLLAPAPTATARTIADGLAVLWSPLTIISLQLVWATVFWFTGRSQVTASRSEIFVLNSSV